MLNNRQPILIAPRLSATATPIDELLDRFNRYGAELNNHSLGNVKKLIVLGDIYIEETAASKFINLEYHFIGKGLFTQVLSVIRVLPKLTSRPRTLIAGDLWLGGLYVLISKNFGNPTSKTQISFHGRPGFGKNIFVLKAKRLFFKIILKKVDSIRVVSNSLMEFLVEEYKVDEEKFFVAPIPIDTQKLSISDHKPIPIGIVGRLHPERGVLDALRIISSVAASLPAHSIYFLGDGPLLNGIKEWRASLSNPEAVAVCGAVPNMEVLSTLGKVQILLSCAPEEGYGLTLREAILSGASVVARRNAGTLELRAKFPDAIFLFENIDEARSLIAKLLHNENHRIDMESARMSQILEDQLSLLRLVSSWTE